MKNSSHNFFSLLATPVFRDHSIIAGLHWYTGRLGTILLLDVTFPFLSRLGPFRYNIGQSSVETPDQLTAPANFSPQILRTQLFSITVLQIQSNTQYQSKVLAHLPNGFTSHSTLYTSQGYVKGYLTKKE